MRRPIRVCDIISILLILFMFAGVSGCTATRFYQRKRLSDRAMRFDADGRLVYIRNKTEAAREGAFGGFGGAAAGGCGCQ